MYTTPFATAGEESTALPVGKLHSLAPVEAFSAYTLLSSEPTYTTPFATAGEDSTELPVGKLHSRAPVEAFSAYTFLSSEPTYTTPFHRAAGGNFPKKDAGAAVRCVLSVLAGADVHHPIRHGGRGVHSIAGGEAPQ